MASTPVASRQYGSVQSTRSTAAPVALLDTLLQGLGRLFIASTDHSSVITARARLGIWLNLRSSSRKCALSKWRTFTDERATQVYVKTFNTSKLNHRITGASPQETFTLEAAAKHRP
ncbi:hypothetical protein T4D_3379 [Trichinella pseudospiralis]|uniref:Uncharacterized protein n=1 Tax=Trichinella pseudospiralis TaxID=6337 RepID=A0A0V1F3T8_TRIPS|nr:hypothetical protein T4D_3379 [Trichinella pseudospiralis]